jgi:hypothetical protein
MDCKKILWPTKWKILFVIVYIVLFAFFGMTYVTDGPQERGFPFTYQIKGCSFPFADGSSNCVDKFFPEMLLLDILIPVGIYAGIGLIENRKK